MTTNGVGRVNRGPSSGLRPRPFFSSKLDPKNRFSVPAALRRAVQSNEWYLVPTMEQKTSRKLLRLYQRSDWERALSKISGQERDSFLTYSRQATVDKFGRIRIPQQLMEKLGFTANEKLKIVQHENHLRVWREVDFKRLPLPAI